MKTSTKLIIAGTTIGVVVAGVLIAKHFINVDKEKQSVQIIGGCGWSDICISCREDS